MNIRVGVDITDCRRIREFWKKRGEKFAHRVLTEKEINYCKSRYRSDPIPCVAARFAAKEAVIKALGRFVPWKDIEIYNLKSGEPRLHLSGKALKAAEALGLKNWEISLSHLEEYALAMVVAY